MSADSLKGKACRACGIERALAAFLPSRFTADGMTERCRACVFDSARRDRERRDARRFASELSRS